LAGPGRHVVLSGFSAAAAVDRKLKPLGWLCDIRPHATGRERAIKFRTWLW
jgi:hypothetical protein